MKNISIIIPVYNNTQYLKECLDSIFNQTEKPDEIVLVDDGSDIQHAEYIDSLADGNEIIKVFHKENGGQLSSRMYGIERAEGEWVAFVDSDDCVDVRMIESLRNEIDKEPTIDCIIFSYRRFVDNSFLPGEVNQDNAKIIISDKRELYRRVFLDESYNSMCRKICRKELFTENLEQYYEGRFAEDLVQSIDVYKNAEKIMFKNLPLYEYRDNADSITNTVRKKRYQLNTSPYERVYSLLLSEKVFSEDDWMDYRIFSRTVLVNQLKRLVISETSFVDAHAQINQVRTTDYCSFMLGKTTGTISPANRILFFLFKYGFDLFLYWIGRIRRLFP